MKHRVVITGIGSLFPNGNDPQTYRDNLIAGVSGAAPITTFDASAMPTSIAAEVKWDGEWVAQDRRTTFALETARQAFKDANRCGSAPKGSGRLCIGVGTEIFSAADYADMKKPDFEFPQKLSERLKLLHMPGDLVAHVVSERFQFDYPPLVMVSTCASSADAVGSAYREVASGRCRWMMGGGTDSVINPLGVTAFSKLHTLSTQNEIPEEASKPFSRNRDGFLMGEGAGMMILERLEDAQERGAEIYAEIAGYGNALDAYGISEPHPEGRGALQAMQRALADAGVNEDEIDVINGHATGTRKNDPIETLACKRLLGDRAIEVPICATKCMIGHLVAGAGVAELTATVMCMNVDMVHPTLNLHDPDPDCDLDYVPLVAREHKTSIALCNSFGFGGMNASTVVRKL
jgi:3-oxoacyl-[acyl-carrier-protein] synthase II